MLKVAQSDGQRICRVGWRRRSREAEPHRHHPLDLVFVGPTTAGEGHLDPGWRVFRNDDARPGEREQHHSRSPRHRHCRLQIAVHEDLLDAGGLDGVLGNELGEVTL